jgi:uroporphyrinogen-III synthase
MPERKYTILSTASLPFGRITPIPESINLLVVPFIEIVARSQEKIKSAVEHYGENKITAIFTSAHAIRIVAGLLHTKPDWKIYCIRNETRLAAEEHFSGETRIVFADNAQSLSRQIILDGEKEGVFFCGDQRLDILPNYLKSQGFGLTELVVYDTRTAGCRIAEQPDIILFFSPSAVRSFFSQNSLCPDTTLFAMGTTTADSLKDYTNNLVIVSPQSDKAFVYHMALKYAAAHSTI